MRRASSRSTGHVVPVLLTVSAAFTLPAHAMDMTPRATMSIARSAGPIVLDGLLDDPGWQQAEPITTWYETGVGENAEPPVRTRALLAYDSRYFYVALQCEDPQPDAIRAPLGDHDAVAATSDYAGVIIDGHDDGKTAQMFMANPHGVQYDAIRSDASGEDSSPDFRWDAAGGITGTGWSLELRIPLSSLRYANQAAPTWRILLHRNYPRDRRYQIYSAQIPRDVNCFICNASALDGLSGLPRGAHLLFAPYARGEHHRTASPGVGMALDAGDARFDQGLDLKWSPSSNAAVDVTVNPDFSQVESDAAQITANERSALLFPEKRPFFLEGVDLLSTPMAIVHTRSIAAPSWGTRATGRTGATAYASLVTRDRGGGSAILPGPQGSEFALEDFRSTVGVLRVRHDLGRSFVGMLASGRAIDHGGSNAVFGPDFEWRPRAADAYTGQALWSQSRTPNRPDLSGQWDGRTLSDAAFLLGWSHAAERGDWNVQAMDVGPGFRADNGFVPQVGYRELYATAGRTTRPARSFLSRVRLYTEDYYDAESAGRPLNQHLSLGSEMDGLWNSAGRVELTLENVRVGDRWLQRFRPRVRIEASPGRVLNQLSVDCNFGQEIDFANAREGDGINVVASLTVRPSSHLECAGTADVRTLNVAVPGGPSGRLFTASIARLRSTWSFTSRAYVRLIGQYVENRNDPTLSTLPVPSREAQLDASALIAYGLDWQTVVYAGYGDARTWSESADRLAPSRREVFAKLSYAWQR